MKLVLFDIDGTLIYHVGQRATDRERFYSAMKKTWGVDADTPGKKHVGWTNRGSVWDILQSFHISRDEFDHKYIEFQQYMLAYLVEKSKLGKIYEAIPTAHMLVRLLLSNQHHHMGLLTGNVPSVGRWKLQDSGFPEFPFGVFGDESDSRIELASLVYKKAKKFFGKPFAPQEVVVIGDTMLDVQCGKAIGAKTIAVTTGKHHTRDMLANEMPDLLVDSLMDERVLALLGLKQ